MIFLCGKTFSVSMFKLKRGGAMKIILKIVIRTVLGIVLLFAGFAVGFPVGQHMGFTTGTEWAIMQVDILAREAGVHMPINFEEGAFHVVVKQQPDLYKRAWRLADRYDREMEYWSEGKRTLSEKVGLKRSPHPIQ
jgi:hypothetical protein